MRCFVLVFCLGAKERMQKMLALNYESWPLHCENDKSTSAAQPTIAIDHYRLSRTLRKDRFDHFASTLGVSFSFSEEYFEVDGTRDPPMQWLSDDGSFSRLDIDVLSLESKVVHCTGSRTLNANRSMRTQPTLMFKRVTHRILLCDASVYADYTRILAPNNDVISEFCIVTLLMLSYDRTLLSNFLKSQEFGDVCFCPVMVYVAQRARLSPIKRKKPA